MKKAYLHSQIRRSIPLSFSTDEVASRLAPLHGLRIDNENPDFMPFVLQWENIYIEGVVERWQGTESRLRFEGELNLSPYNSEMRTRLAVVLGLVVIATVAYFVLNWSLASLGSEGIWFYANTHCALSLVVGIAFGAVTGLIVMRDPHAAERWKAQQELGKFAETVEAWAKDG